MALPFLEKSRKAPDQMVAVDLGSRTTKAVHVQRRGAAYVLSGYTVLDAPICEKTVSPEMLAEHLKAMSASLGAKTKLVTLTIGVNEAIVRHVDMPRIPVEDMRPVLKLNSKTYLQQDLSGHVFDCHIIPPANAADAPEGQKPLTGSQKDKVLVAGVRQQVLSDLVEGAKRSGLVADHIVPASVSPANAFELAQPEEFKSQVVALVDVGFRNSTICILQRGELVLSRVVPLGGDHMTANLSELMKISYAEAEGIKVGMAQEVESNLASVLIPLGRELRASIDFYEHQQDKTVSRVYLSGASARSELIFQTLQTELMIECRPWDPTSFLQLEIPQQQAEEFSQIAPQLTVAVGAALTALSPTN
jgi:type IV pilus assembly protein PilM